jgi:deoxyribodipyrimidine photolyase-related protein
MKSFLIFPVHLLKDIKYLKDYSKVYFLLSDFYFKKTFGDTKKTFHLAAIKYYLDYLKKNKVKVEIVKEIPKVDDLYYYDPVDRDMIPKWGTMIDSPLFITSNVDLDRFYEEKKTFNQTSFYAWQRHRTGILMNENDKPLGGKLTFDTENRNKLDIDPPVIKYPKPNKYVKQAQKELGTDSIVLFPTTHTEAEKWFEVFIEKRLKNFGKYQDAITQDEDDIILFHSGISCMLNIGLLLVKDVLIAVEKADVPINSKEGFIRQILGWRELCRLTYKIIYDEMKNANTFGHTRRLSKAWYDGTTGLEPLDNCIKKAFKYGYLHHIERLMIVGQLMLLCEIHPDDIFNWFLEFANDSYIWVMAYNCLSMVGYAGTTTKPYISSSNYILKMSNYKKDGHWDKIWDSLYWNFVNKNADKLKKIPRISFQVNFYNKKSNKEKEEFSKIANDFIKSVTKIL